MKNQLCKYFWILNYLQLTTEQRGSKVFIDWKIENLFIKKWTFIKKKEEENQDTNMKKCCRIFNKI